MRAYELMGVAVWVAVCCGWRLQRSLFVSVHLQQGVGALGPARNQPTSTPLTQMPPTPPHPTPCPPAGPPRALRAAPVWVAP